MKTTRIAGTIRNDTEARDIRRLAQIHAYATHIRSIAKCAVSEPVIVPRMRHTDDLSRGATCDTPSCRRLHDQSSTESSPTASSRIAKGIVPRWSPYEPYLTA